VAPVWHVQAHEVAHLLGEQAEAGFALPERLLGQLALRDVSRYILDGDDVPRPVVDGLIALLGPDQGAVLAIAAQHGRLFGEAQRAIQQMPVVGIDPLDAEIRIGVVLLRGVAGHLGR
jgi:hypothetical protein